MQIAIDGCFVLLDLGWSESRLLQHWPQQHLPPSPLTTKLTTTRTDILNPNCDPGEKDEAPAWLEHLALFSLCIDFLFLLEIPAALYAFGWRFYGLSMTEKAVPRECHDGARSEHNARGRRMCERGVCYSLAC